MWVVSKKSNIFGLFRAGIGVRLLILLFSATGAMAAGLESAGNVEGVLQWQLGDLEPGKSAREVVIFAHADSYGALSKTVKRARRDFSSMGGVKTVFAPEEEIVWLENSATDFALEASGCFSSTDYRPGLADGGNGQLHQFFYYVHYNDGEPRQAGVPIWPQRINRKPSKRGQLDNLRVIEPVRAVSETEAMGVTETDDKKLLVRIRAVMGKGATTGVEFVVTNIGVTPLSAVSLGVYSYIRCGEQDSHDYSTLDSKTGGLLIVDSSDGRCVAMTGLRQADAGYTGTRQSWSAGKRLSQGTGLAAEQWKPYGGRETVSKRLRPLIVASMPCAPAPFVEPNEPPTVTLGPEEASKVLTADWLFQADNNPTLERVRDEIRWSRELAARLMRDRGAPSIEAELTELTIVEEIIAGSDAGAVDERMRELYLAVRTVKRSIMLSNPVVDFSRVLFVDIPYPQGREPKHQARHRDGMMAVPGGRLLVLEGLHPGAKLRKLAPSKPGNFWRPDLSFDGEKVLFCMKLHDEKSFHLYEINIDGTDLRQLTSGDYDDLDPIYLPDGKIMFSTTRANTYIRCMPYTYCYVLARSDSDG